jgi:DNA-binding MltR family transcriptional regulator
MSRGKKKPSLRDLTRESPTQEDTQAILNYAAKIAKAEEVPVGADRIIAISMGALLDSLIEARIVHALKNKDDIEEMFADRGPLGTFSSKIQMAYALGQIDSTVRDDLNCIRRIRNVFAHAKTSVTMDTPLVAKECAKLKLMRLACKNVDKDAFNVVMKNMKPRNLFHFHAALISANLQLGQLDEIKDADPDPQFKAALEKLQRFLSPETVLERMFAAKVRAKSSGSS